MIALKKVEDLRPARDRAKKQRDLLKRLLLVREGSCTERWGSWGTLAPRHDK